MAKAGTGKGNAFASPGPSYPHLEIVRKEAASRVPTMLDEKTRERENSIKQIAAQITEPRHRATRERVMKQIGDGTRQARLGRDPLSAKLPCDGCRAGSAHGTHHFLCQSGQRAKFKTVIERKVYNEVKTELYSYAAEQRKVLGIDEPMDRSPDDGKLFGFLGVPSSLDFIEVPAAGAAQVILPEMRVPPSLSLSRTRVRVYGWPPEVFLYDARESLRLDYAAASGWLATAQTLTPSWLVSLCVGHARCCRHTSCHRTRCRRACCHRARRFAPAPGTGARARSATRQEAAHARHGRSDGCPARRRRHLQRHQRRRRPGRGINHTGTPCGHMDTGTACARTARDARASPPHVVRWVLHV